MIDSSIRNLGEVEYDKENCLRCQFQQNPIQKWRTARIKLTIMNNWSKTKNHRKFSNQCPKLLLSENVYNGTLFAMRYVNLKMRHSQHVSTPKILRKMQKNALFDVFLAQKVP